MGSVSTNSAAALLLIPPDGSLWEVGEDGKSPTGQETLRVSTCRSRWKPLVWSLGLSFLAHGPVKCSKSALSSGLGSWSWVSQGLS